MRACAYRLMLIVHGSVTLNASLRLRLGPGTNKVNNTAI